MPADTIKHLRISGRTGEVEELAECPGCAEAEASIVQFERQIRTLNSRLTKAEKDREAEARAHKLWPEAEALFHWWALATGHEGCTFAGDEFFKALPRLKEHKNPVAILQGIAGIAFDPNTKQTKNGGTERYDSWELLMKSGPVLKRYQERAPGWPTRENHWKNWLLERIESGLTVDEPEATEQKTEGELIEQLESEFDAKEIDG